MEWITSRFSHSLSLCFALPSQNASSLKAECMCFRLAVFALCYFNGISYLHLLISMKQNVPWYISLRAVWLKGNNWAFISVSSSSSASEYRCVVLLMLQIAAPHIQCCLSVSKIVTLDLHDLGKRKARSFSTAEEFRIIKYFFILFSPSYFVMFSLY